MEVTKIAEIEEKSTEAAVDFESVVAEDTEDVGPGQHLFGEPLEMYLLREPKLAVAFSGGCDSALLLAAAKLAGCEVHAYLVKTAFQPDFELDDARTVAAALEVPLTVVEADVLAQADICANPADRCYLCKRFLFDEVRRTAAAAGFTVVVAGPNASDDPERRPGFTGVAFAPCRHDQGQRAPRARQPGGALRPGPGRAHVRQAELSLPGRLRAPRRVDHLSVFAGCCPIARTVSRPLC